MVGSPWGGDRSLVDPALDRGRGPRRRRGAVPSGGICSLRLARSHAQRRARWRRRLAGHDDAAHRARSAGRPVAARRADHRAQHRVRGCASASATLLRQRQPHRRRRAAVGCGSGRSWRAGSRARRARRATRRRCAAAAPAARAADRAASRARPGRAGRRRRRAAGAPCAASGSRSGESCSALKPSTGAGAPSWQARQSPRAGTS